MGAALVVARGQVDAPERAVLSDDCRNSRGREKPVLSNDDATKSRSDGHLDDGLRGHVIVEATIAANHKGGALKVNE